MREQRLAQLRFCSVVRSKGVLSGFYYWTKIWVGIRLQSTYFSCGLIQRKCCAVLTVQPSWRSPPDCAHRVERPRVRPDACASPRSRRAQCLLSYSVGPVLPERDGQRDSKLRRCNARHSLPEERWASTATSRFACLPASSVSRCDLKSSRPELSPWAQIWERK